jgi:multicomponent Na+:H+ antiporter subunit E
VRRIVGLGVWAFLVWSLLTWTFTVEQVAFGIGVAALVTVGLAPLGSAPRPWRFRPTLRGVMAGLGLVRLAVAKLAKANVELARRVWLPGRPLRSGMVVTTTTQHSPAGLATVGVITSLIVDNQLVDLDRQRHELQYHTVAVPTRSQPPARAAINGPVERLLDEAAGRGERR